MKLLILSDLHSNAEGVRAILQKEGGADAIYAAGDFVDYGTDPAGTIAWVRANGVRCVRGNHDDRLISVYRAGGYAGLPQERCAWVHHNCERLAEADVKFLESLPTHLSFTADGIEYLMAHRCGEGYATIDSQYHFDRYWEENFALPHAPGAERRMIFGHSHRQLVQRHDGRSLWLNPGSASYRRPDEPSKDAFYAVIEDGAILLRHTPYNRTPLAREVQRMRPFLMPEEWHVADFFFCKTEADGPDRPWELPPGVKRP